MAGVEEADARRNATERGVEGTTTPCTWIGDDVGTAVVEAAAPLP